DALVHLVCSSHAWEGEVQPLRPPCLHKALCQDQCCFGLTCACYILQQEQLGPVFQLHRRRVLLQGSWLTQVVDQGQGSRPFTHSLPMQTCHRDGLSSLRLCIGPILRK